jgi:crossover junction endodeoxyribonuclease RuvC
MITIGIDPGFEGGIAVIDSGVVVAAEPMPVVGAKKPEIDAQRIVGLIRCLDPHKAVAVIEKVGARPGQGVVSMFRFGEGVGVIRGILASFGVSVLRPTPQQWKKVVLAGTAKDKDAAIQLVRDRWPDVELIPKGKRVPHNGIADAVCLAEFGLLTRRS